MATAAAAMAAAGLGCSGSNPTAISAAKTPSASQRAHAAGNSAGRAEPLWRTMSRMLRLTLREGTSGAVTRRRAVCVTAPFGGPR